MPYNVCDCEFRPSQLHKNSKDIQSHFLGAHCILDYTIYVSAGNLAIRSLAISGTFAVATSMAARTDSVHTAAHQICLQVWLATSLLADALAVAAQTLTARNVAAEKRQAQAGSYTFNDLGFRDFHTFIYYHTFKTIDEYTYPCWHQYLYDELRQRLEMFSG